MLWLYGASAGGTTAEFYNSGSTTTVANAEMELPFAADVSNLEVACFGSVSSGTQTFTIVKNGTADTTLTCQLTGGAKTCEDAVGTVSFNPTDKLAVQSVGSGSASAPTCTIGLAIARNGGGLYDSIVSFGAVLGGSPSAGTFYCGPVGTSTSAGSCTVGTESSGTWIAPTAGTLSGLRVVYDTAIGIARTDVFTARNVTTGIDSDLTVTFCGRCAGGANAGATCTANSACPSSTCVGDAEQGSTTCTTNCGFSAGDLLVVKRVHSGTGSELRRIKVVVTASGLGSWLGTRNTTGNMASTRYSGPQDGFGTQATTGAWAIANGGTARHLCATVPTIPGVGFYDDHLFGIIGLEPGLHGYAAELYGSCR